VAAPEVPIEVDRETGVWSTDGVPMLYVPRHFFVNNHRAIEQALGRDTYAEQLYEPGFRSAYSWCGRTAETLGLDGIAVFHLYMQRLSQRGWGQFDASLIDGTSGCGDLRVRHSCFVLQRSAEDPPARSCYMFAGWAPGALAWVGERGKRPIRVRGEEVQCAAEGHAFCTFRLVSIDEIAPEARPF
jgi:hypothetical protein